MYGWRARLGLIVPSSNTTNEPEFSAHLPPGVSLHTARMHLEGVNASALEAMAEEVERCVGLLATADVDVVVYGCTTGSLVKGPGYDVEIESRIEEAAGVPGVATAAAVKRALEALDATSLALATPYVDALTDREVEFLEAAGFDVGDVAGLGDAENLQIGRRTPESAYQAARALDVADADAVFVSCTNYRTFEVIEALEADLGVPVVTSNQATLWNALRTLGVDYGDVELGRLFER